MRKAILIVMLSLLMAGTANAAAAIFEYEDFSDMSDFSYTQDRNMPATVESASFDGDYRLHYTVDGSSGNYDGIRHTVTMPEYMYQTYSVDMYVGSDWKDSTVNAGMWAWGTASDGTTSAWPIIAYRSGTEIESGFYTWDYWGGTWSLVSGWSDDNDLTGWHTLSFTLTQGEGMSYYLDGVLMGTFDDASTYDLAAVILNVYSVSGVTDYYFDNFTASAQTPIPGAVWLLGSGLAGLLGLRRRFS